MTYKKNGKLSQSQIHLGKHIKKGATINVAPFVLSC